MAASIPAGSQHQAMDWSLVLVSQGIDTIIDRFPPEGDPADPNSTDAVPGGAAENWRLIVSGADLGRAVDAIRQYRDENRRDGWRRDLPWPGLTFDWRSVLWLLVFVVLFAMEVTHRADLRPFGIMNGVAVKSGEWWRLITAVTLHADLGHLAANLTMGLVLLGLAMGVFGPGFGLFIPLAAGIAGNVVGLAVYPETFRGLGASGMVMGALGLLTAQSVALLRHGLTHRQLAVRAVLSGCLLLVILGFSPDQHTDVLAHVAGFATGALFGVGACFLPASWMKNLWVGRLGQCLVAGILAVSWWLALHYGRAI